MKTRRRKKHLLITLCSMAGAAAVSIAGGYIWLWGWSWSNLPEFHENWSTEERQALADFDASLPQILSESISTIDLEPDFLEIWTGVTPLGSLKNNLQTIIQGRTLCAAVREQIFHFARCGHARDEHKVYTHFDRTHTSISPTTFAAATAQLRAVEALVSHGSNPNSISQIKEENNEPQEGDTPLTPVINGLFLNGRQLPWEERRKTADFLIAHGADINGTRRAIGIACDVPMVIHHSRDPRPWMWALDHGKTITIENLCRWVDAPEAQPLLERVLQEKLVNLNDSCGDSTVLQALLKNIMWVNNEEDWKELEQRQIEQRLDMLLAAGADPNLIPKAGEDQRPGESEEDYKERINHFRGDSYMPLDIATRAMEGAELPQHRELCRRVVEKLRAAGAVSRYAQ